MGLSTFFVLLGVLLAIIGVFVTDHALRLLTAAVVLIGVGVLIGAGGLVT